MKNSRMSNYHLSLLISSQYLYSKRTQMLYSWNVEEHQCWRKWRMMILSTRTHQKAVAGAHLRKRARRRLKRCMRAPDSKLWLKKSWRRTCCARASLGDLGWTRQRKCLVSQAKIAWPNLNEDIIRVTQADHLKRSPAELQGIKIPLIQTTD